MNSHIYKRFIHVVNDKPLNEMRPIDEVDRVTSVMDISKIFQKEKVTVKAEEYLELVSKNVDVLNKKFNRILSMGFPSSWDFGEVFI